MTAKEKLLQEVEELDEAKATRARIVIADYSDAEPDMVGLPEAWKTFEDGTPVPNWVALRHEAREGR